MNAAQKANAYEALLALGKATPNQLMSVGDFLHVPGVRATIRGDAVVAFHFNAYYPRRIKQVVFIRARFGSEPNYFGLPP